MCPLRKVCIVRVTSFHLKCIKVQFSHIYCLVISGLQKVISDQKKVKMASSSPGMYYLGYQLSFEMHENLVTFTVEVIIGI